MFYLKLASTLTICNYLSDVAGSLWTSHCQCSCPVCRILLSLSSWNPQSLAQSHP